MKIEPKELTVKKLTDGFLDSAEQGVVIRRLRLSYQTIRNYN